VRAHAALKMDEMRRRIADLGNRARMFLRSIRFRLTLWSITILALILLAFSVFVYIRQAQELEMEAVAKLQLRSQQLAVYIQLSGLFEGEHEYFAEPGEYSQGVVTLSEYETLALLGPDEEVLQKVGDIDDATIQQLIYYYRKSNRADQPAVYPTGRGVPGWKSKPNDTIYLISPLRVERHKAGWMILGRPVDPDAQLSGLAATLFLGSLAVLGVALAGGTWLAGRALAPVRTITRTARGISETDLHKRLRLGTRDELGELADTFDAMLDRLQAAFDRQRQFTADASHELRTPLTIVSLEADQALNRRRSSEEYERALKVIRSENEFMAHLVNDLLTLARMDAGQTRLKLEPLDLNDIALEVVERLSTLAHRDGIELQVDDDPGARVLGDRQYLTQMLTNLVENAIKYAGGKGHHVRVESGSRSNNGKSEAWVRVSDDGPGIPQEHLPRLFDRFYRVDKARTRGRQNTGDVSGQGAVPNVDGEKELDGSGLGLSIVQWIAEAHGGKVTLQSAVGQGSVFEVQLPLA